jgi:WD40 repeat protein/tRNA A-37 threonylcarbamoyl transferase component Bud32
MTRLLTCPKGHRWEIQGSDPEPEALGAPVCPVCGAVGSEGTLFTGSDEVQPPTFDPLSSGPADDSLTLPPSGYVPPVAAAFAGAVPGYEILGELGRGGMGVVYKARQKKLQRMVALKMIISGVHAGPRELVRFQTEAQAVARLQHPNVVQIYEVGEAEGRPFLALEFVSGGTLSQRLTGTPLPARRAAQMVEALARAIYAAHERSIIHRDLKPANILLTDDDEPKIADFGLAKQLSDVGPTQTEAVLGTPAYMSPEQAGGKLRDIGPATDQYALGAILYEMLTGQPPFRGETKMDTLDQVRKQEPVPPRRLNLRVPRDLDTICLKCLQKEPRKRYATARDLADDLQRFLAGRPIQARPVGRLERAWKWARRRPAVAGLLAALVVALVGGFAGITWGYFQAEQARREETRARISAEQARELAVVARHQEAEQREKAQVAERRAEEQRDRAEASLYYSRIAEARLEWQANNAARARTLIDQCDLARRGWEWRYLANAFRADLFTFRHRISGAWVHQVAYSADGRFLVSGGGDPFQSDRGGEAVVWDADRGKLLQVLPHHRYQVNAVAVSPDGRLVASVSMDGLLRLSDRASGTALRTLPGGQSPIRSAAFSPDGQSLATAREDGSVQVWAVSAGPPLHTIPGHGKPPCGLAYSPDGRLTVAEPSGRITVWDAPTGQHVSEVSVQPVPLGRVTFSADGGRLASNGADGVLRVWEAADGRLVRSLFGNTSPVNDVALSPDGHQLATACADNTVRVWDVDGGRERLTLRGHELPVRSVCFHPNGRRLASAGNDGLVKVWDLTAPPDYVPQAAAATEGCEACAFDADSRRVYAVHLGGGFDTTEARTGLLRGNRSFDMTGKWETPASLAAFSDDGRRLAAIKRDRMGVKVWDPAAGTELRALEAKAAPLLDVGINRDGSRVAAAGLWHRDGERIARDVLAWDVSAARPLAHVRIVPVLSPEQIVFVRYGPGAVALSPDGRLLAFDELVREDRPGQKPRLSVHVKVWDLEAGREWVSLAGREGPVNALAFSPDGGALASAGLDGRVLSWEVASGQPLRRMRTSEPLYALAFSPDGRLLAGASREVVQVWDAQTGQDVLTLRGAPQRTGDPGFNPRVAFSPDGNWLAANNWRNTVSVWDGRPPTEETRADRRRAAKERAQPASSSGK